MSFKLDGMTYVESMTGMQTDEVQRSYLDRLGNLDCAHLVPPAILGAARFVFAAEEDADDLLSTLPLVSESFWRAASDAIDEADWPVQHPNDIRCGTKDFNAQWRISAGLFSILRLAGAEGSKHTDKMRRKAADEIVAASKTLRSHLDKATGYDPYGDWLGLHSPLARDMVNEAGTKHLDAPFSMAPSQTGNESHGERGRKWGVVHSLNLQQLLVEAEVMIQRQAYEHDTDWMTHPRQSRFVVKLQEWLSEVHIVAGNDTAPNHYKPCVKTANAILRKRHPEVKLKENPAKTKRLAT